MGCTQGPAGLHEAPRGLLEPSWRGWGGWGGQEGWLPGPAPAARAAAASGGRRSRSLHQKHGAAQRRIGHCAGSIWQQQVQQQQVHSASVGAQGTRCRPQRRPATHRTRSSARAAGGGCSQSARLSQLPLRCATLAAPPQTSDWVVGRQAGRRATPHAASAAPEVPLKTNRQLPPRHHAPAHSVLSVAEGTRQCVGQEFDCHARAVAGLCRLCVCVL